MLAPGKLLSNRYRLDCLLGEGGMGSVWGATDVRMRRGVAVKVLKAPGADPDKSAEQAATERRRLLREARAASAVRHPNVVQVLDVLDEGEVSFLVMELLEGRSLRQHLDRVGRLDLITACALVAQVASAVSAAHERGIVHRDLKPENIFLTGAGEVSAATEVKVLDFGIAKVLHRAGSTTTENLTREGHLLGSPPYMSPEQAFGEADIDHRTDLWSLGIVLYECLSGVLPTRGENTGQVFKIITKRGVVPIEQVAKDVPADIARLLGRMLAQEPAQRPSSMQEVADVLRRRSSAEAPAETAHVPPALDSLQGLIVAETAPVPSPAPTAASVPRRRSGVLVTLGGLAALAGLVVVVAWPRVEERPSSGEVAKSHKAADTASPAGPPSAPPARASAAPTTASTSESAPAAAAVTPSPASEVRREPHPQGPIQVVLVSSASAGPSQRTDRPVPAPTAAATPTQGEAAVPRDHATEPDPAGTATANNVHPDPQSTAAAVSGPPVRPPAAAPSAPPPDDVEDFQDLCANEEETLAPEGPGAHRAQWRPWE